MRRRVTLKDHFLETRLFTTRVVVALVFMVLALLGLVGRLFYLQVVQHELYTTESEDNRVKIVALPPNRGLIFDRNGVPLADNLPSYLLEITPEQVKDMDATLRALSAVIDLRSEDLERFRSLLKRTRRFDAVPLRFHLSEEEVARFSIDRYRFPGVDIAVRLSRHYPLGKYAVQAVGYVGRIDEDELQNLDEANYSGTTHCGKIGIERSYENQLHGTVGYQQVETNAQGRVLRVLETTPPIAGQNLYLNIDFRLQVIAEAALGSNDGALVAIDPNTGGVLALVSTPGYDPEPFVNGIDSATYKALQTDPDKPLYNRALRGQYPPGSTIKPFIGLAGLAMGATEADHRVFCPGFFQLPGVAHKYRDWRHQGHGSVDLRDAIIQSCDVYFYQLALALGIDRIDDFLGRFGFGRNTGLDVLEEKGGLLPTREWKRRVRKQDWYQGETLITGIGQGYLLATPLQLASATATLSMHGQHYAPRLLYATQDPGGGALKPVPPVVLPKVDGVAPEAWQQVIDAMTGVVNSAHGTARTIGVNAPYLIAGKTGTAQVFGIKQGEKYNKNALDESLLDHALFVAFAPVEHPRIAVAVIVEHGGHGGSVGAPIVRMVMDQYLLYSTP
jgi:penicillin-binding protein 2